jgi:hypothetical protein
MLLLFFLFCINRINSGMHFLHQNKGKGPRRGGESYRGPPDHHTLDHSTQFILILKRNNKSTQRQGERRRDRNGIII